MSFFGKIPKLIIPDIPSQIKLPSYTPILQKLPAVPPMPSFPAFPTIPKPTEILTPIISPVQDFVGGGVAAVGLAQDALSGGVGTALGGVSQFFGSVAGNVTGFLGDVGGSLAGVSGIFGKYKTIIIIVIVIIIIAVIAYFALPLIKGVSFGKSAMKLAEKGISKI